MIIITMIQYLIGIPLVIWLFLKLIQIWMRGPTKGSDSKVRLTNKTVVITGKYKYNHSLFIIEVVFDRSAKYSNVTIPSHLNLHRLPRDR